MFDKGNLKRRILLMAISVCAIFAVFFLWMGVGVQAATTTKNVSGKYLYQSKTVLLNRINAIRKEACDEGVLDPRDKSRRLTPSDYVPIKWSKSMEEICKTRAVELTQNWGHTRPNGENPWSVKASDGSESYAENIAYNFDEDSALLTGIKQFYEEKKDWVNQTGKTTGHYTSLINPNYQYTALAGFQENGSQRCYVANEFAYSDTSGDAQITTKTTAVTVPVEITAVDMTGLTVSPTSKTITAGDTLQLTAKKQPDNTTDETTVKWSSSNASVATVDSNGKVTAKAAGTATITASCGNYSATTAVTVNKKEVALKSITVTPASKTLIVGETQLLNITKNPANTTATGTISWKSSNANIAAVGANGKVTAKAAGTATITATFGGKSASATITVNNKTIGDCPYSINNGVLTIGEDGKTYQLPDGNDKENYDVDWPWKNDTDKISKIVIRGTVNAGNSLNGIFENFGRVNQIEGLKNLKTSKVKNLYNTFDFCEKLQSLNGIESWDTSSVEYMGNTFANCKSLNELDLSRWNTSKVRELGSIFTNCENLININVANWNTRNVVFAYGTFYGCKSLKSLDLSGWDLSNLGNGYNKTWYSDELGIAGDMFAQAPIERIKLGSKFKFYCMYQNGESFNDPDLTDAHEWQLKGTNPVYTARQMMDQNPQKKNPGWYVNPVALTDFNIKADKNNLTVGDTAKITPTFVPSNMTYSKAVTYTSSNPKVATVDGSGKVMAKDAGTVTITAKTNTGVNDKTKTETIKVQKRAVALTGLNVSPSSKTMTVGDTVKLTAVKKPDNTTDTNNISWQTSNSKVATISGSGTMATVTAKGAGAVTITANCNGKTAYASITVAAKTPVVRYRTQVQTYGWEKDYRKDGDTSGTQGQSKRLEAIQIHLENQPYDGDIEYRTHVQTFGWEKNYQKHDGISGTVGKAKRLEAIQIRLTGSMKDHYDVYYRVHAQHFGWLGWAKDNQYAGTSGYGYRLEAIEIKLVKKGDAAPGRTTGVFKPMVQYRTHIQRIGWGQGYVNEGQMAGTSGRSLRLEGANIKLVNKDYNGGIRYKTHVQTYGWQDWCYDGNFTGTSGQSKRLEAIQIELTGDMAKHYDVYYRVHAQHFGNLGWAKNGEEAGTAGYAYRLEGLWIELVPKGGAAPGSTAHHFYQK